MTQPIISMMAAIGKNREIGKGGRLLWRLADDAIYFKENTVGKIVIMGSNTYKNCIGGALQDRLNIVISTKADPITENRDNGVFIVRNMREAIEVGKAWCIINNCPEIVIIGGEKVYKQGMRYANALYITHIDKEDPDADCFFPIIDPDLWKVMFTSAHTDQETGINFQITGYTAIL